MQHLQPQGTVSSPLLEITAWRKKKELARRKEHEDILPWRESLGRYIPPTHFAEEMLS